jgi:hypothetical protein
MLPEHTLPSSLEIRDSRPLRFLTSQPEECAQSLLPTPVSEWIQQKLALLGLCNTNGKGVYRWGHGDATMILIAFLKCGFTGALLQSAPVGIIL